MHVIPARGHVTTAQPTHLDKINSQIVGLLFGNSRKNFADIAEEVGISKNAAWSRYLKMKEAGVITGATVQVNYKKLGYDAVGTVLLDIENTQMEKLDRYVKAHVPDAFGPVISTTKYNVRLVVPIKNITDLGKLKEGITKKIPVAEINSSLWTDIWFTPENLTQIPVPLTKTSTPETSGNPFHADQTDLSLIGALAEDSRTSFRALATQMNVSVDTIARRYRRLREQNVIVPRIQIAPSKIGYSATVHSYLKITAKHNMDAVLKKMLQCPEVFYVMKFRGDLSVGVMFMVKSVEDMLETGEYIARTEGVKRLETVVSSASDKWPLPRTYTSVLGNSIIPD